MSERGRAEPVAWAIEDHVTYDADEGAEWVEEYGEATASRPDGVKILYTMEAAREALARELEEKADNVMSEKVHGGDQALRFAARHIREGGDE